MRGNSTVNGASFLFRGKAVVEGVIADIQR